MLKKSDKKIIWIVVAAIIVAEAVVLVCVLGPFRHHHEHKKNDETVSRSISHKSSAQNRADASEALGKTLMAARISPHGDKDNDRMKSLEKDKNYSQVLDKDFVNGVYFSDDASDPYKINSYESLISISQHLPKNLSPAAPQMAYDQPELGTVYVPLGVFTGQQNAFVVEMVYVKGQWKVNPYSLVEQIRLSAIISGKK